MITITDGAAAQIKELMVEEDKDGTKYDKATVGLRAFVQGGGCSGFQYSLQIENDPQEADKTFESNGVRIYIDPISIRYLKGAEIDFTDKGFSIKNPNAKTTCGCGSSFSV